MINAMKNKIDMMKLEHNRTFLERRGRKMKDKGYQYFFTLTVFYPNFLGKNSFCVEKYYFVKKCYIVTFSEKWHFKKKVRKVARKCYPWQRCSEHPFYRML